MWAVVTPEAVRAAGTDGGAGPLIVADGGIVVRWPYTSTPQQGCIVETLISPREVRELEHGPGWESRRLEWAQAAWGWIWSQEAINGPRLN
ncbi:MAG TPA: hypothetical protein VGO93_16765 [Candidatus Xenobia bacterium]